MGPACNEVGDQRVLDRRPQSADVIIRIEPGHIRAWDYADEFGTG